VFRFEGSQEPALIPRHSIPLQQWNALLSQLSQFGLKIVDK